MSKEVKILIVEDDENLRFLVAHRLKAEGYTVLEANDGEAGDG
jgi:two-component system response regulator MtrA